MSTARRLAPGLLNCGVLTLRTGDFPCRIDLMVSRKTLASLIASAARTDGTARPGNTIPTAAGPFLRAGGRSMRPTHSRTITRRAIQQLISADASGEATALVRGGRKLTMDPAFEPGSRALVRQLQRVLGGSFLQTACTRCRVLRASLFPDRFAQRSPLTAGRSRGSNRKRQRSPAPIGKGYVPRHASSTRILPSDRWHDPCTYKASVGNPRHTYHHPTGTRPSAHHPAE